MTNGAALFWTLPLRRERELLRLLIALQTLANFLDLASERDARERSAKPGAWMLAIADAVDLDRPLAPCADQPYDNLADAGYVAALIDTCRAGCFALPRYREAHALLTQEARRAGALDLEHEPDDQRRADSLRQLAAREFGEQHSITWWELTAGASSLLTVIVALALAADLRTTEDQIVKAIDAYRWVASLSALLDNYLDEVDDDTIDINNYLKYYASRKAAIHRIEVIIDRSIREVAALHNGERHVVIVTSMVAMFLSSDEAKRAPLRATTRTLSARGGTMTRLLLPALRAWRLSHHQIAG